MQKTSPSKRPLILSPLDERMLRALYDFRYMTALDMAYFLLHSATSLTYIRSRLARLAGGKDFATNTYLCRLSLPKPGVGNQEKIFTLAVKARDFLQREAGLPVDWYFRVNKLKHLGFSHLAHAILLTRVVVAASTYGRNRPYILTHTRLSYDLSRTAGWKVIPDGVVLFTDRKGKKYQILIEIDRGMEYQATFKRLLKDRIEFLESEQYVSLFGVKAVMVAYVTTGQRPEYRETRTATITRWIREVLSELEMEDDWSGIFRVASVDFHDVYSIGLFDSTLAIWEWSPFRSGKGGQTLPRN